MEFDKLFVHAYEAEYGQGMSLTRNRTKLKLAYQPASAGLKGYKELSLSFNETPDVTVLKAPLKALTDIADKATALLDSYSRFLGKNPGTALSVEALVHLPVCAWPDGPLKVLRAIRARLNEGPVVMPFQELLKLFEFKDSLAKDKIELLAEAFAIEGIGMEPDVLGGARAPKAADQVALFAQPQGKEGPRTGAAYLIASLTLQLASAVAAADGDFSQDEADHLKASVLSWKHLEPHQAQRLLASLHLLRAAPASLATLTKKLEPLEKSVKDTIAQFMATVAQADGMVSPDEVRMLERIYKALGLDSQVVFSNVHAVASGSSFKAVPPISATASAPGVSKTAKVTEPAFKLDHERIAALQKDTDRVSSLLANIFTEAEAAVASAPTAAAATAEIEPTEKQSEAPAPAGLAGLDESHASLARLLLSRPSWTRADLEDAAADLDLMLDGALEAINDAAFDAHDMPLVEGDDPVTINPEFLEKVHA